MSDRALFGPNTATAIPSRVEWVDLAKGICIILVVMMHTTLGIEAAMGHEGWMHLFVAFAAPFRMPDFFLISGLFMAQAIKRDWRGFADRRILHFAYFYLLWLVITCGVKCTLEGYSLSEILNHLVTGLYQPFSTLWFIYMLMIFSVVVKITAKVPVVAMVAVGVALRLWQPETGIFLIDQFAGQFIFFYAGYAFAKQFFRLAEITAKQPIQALVLLGLWALLNGAFVVLGYHHIAVVGLVLGFAGAAAIVATSSLIIDWKIGRVLRYMGEHSIVIYLAFFIPMAATRIIALRLDLPIDPGTLSLITLLIACASPLLVHRLIKGTPLNFVFARPRWISLEPRKRNDAAQPNMTPAE